MKYYFLFFIAFLSICSRGQISPLLTVPRGHKEVVENCYFTPDDKYLISADYEKLLCIWDGDNGKQVLRLRDSLSSFIKIEINNSTSYIAALTSGGKLYVIDFRQLKWQVLRDSVLDFSMNRSTGSIFYIAKGYTLNKYDPVKSTIKKINRGKLLHAEKIIALSETTAVVQDAKEGVMILSNDGALQPAGGPLSKKLKLYDYHPAGYLLCGMSNSSSLSLYRVGSKNGELKESVSIKGQVQNVSCQFLANPENFILTSIISNDDYSITTQSPAIYSFKTRKLVTEVGFDFIPSISQLNINFSGKNAVVVRQVGYTDRFFERYDFSSNTVSTVFRNRYDEENILRFACANNSKKIAVFSKELLLPVIYANGKIPSKAISGIKQYGTLSLDIPKNKDTTKAARFNFLYANEYLLNDSQKLVISEIPDSASNLLTGILYTVNKSGTDSNRFFYRELIKPSVNTREICWSDSNKFYVFDLSHFKILHSLSFPGVKIESLAKEGRDILIEKSGSKEKALRYNITDKRVTDTVWESLDRVTRPYEEEDYSRRLEGFPISYANIKDYDFKNGVVCSYPFEPFQVDTVAVLDTAFEVSEYKVMQRENYLRFSFLHSPEKKDVYVSDEIANFGIQQVRYWDDSSYIIMTRQNKLLVYSLAKKTILKTIDCPTNTYPSTSSSRLFVQPHNKYLVVSDKEHNDCFIVDINKGTVVYHLNGFYNPLLRQPPNLLVLEDAAFGNYYIYNNKNYHYVCAVNPFSKTDYVVTTSSGLFDGTDKAIENLYLLFNDTADRSKPWKTLDLSQLKAKYYIPGLWDKLIAGDSTDLPDVESIKNLSLAPEIITDTAYSFTKTYRITLLDKGGGIGPVRIAINGKEVIPDARKSPVTSAKKLTLELDLRPYRMYFGSGVNTIQVYSSNSDSSLTTRGGIVSTEGNGGPQPNPKLFVISIGTSNYKGAEIDLQYSSKDAIDIAGALKTGAKKLFGADSTFSYILTTDAVDSSLLPSKSNIERTFREIGKKAEAKDIVILYLSGHGINASGDFYYLTKDAYTANSSAYAFKEVLNAVGISSNEFTEYLKKVAALKQLLIIDACASGKLVENLVAHREIPYSTLKALDRLKDRTGTHIITGCAADAVSYEASRFGQGLLTYSLLEGMKGASLRDNKFLDVGQWFQYARDRVPQLAAGLGGIQTPQLYSPTGNQSFDVGELDDDEKKLVPLAAEKPVFIKSIFQEEEKFVDVLSVSKTMDNLLFETSSKENKFLFLPVDEFPNAYQVLGRYKSSPAGIEATIKIVHNTSTAAPLTFSFGSTDVKGITTAILGKIKELK